MRLWSPDRMSHSATIFCFGYGTQLLEPELFVDENNTDLPSHECRLSLENEELRNSAPAHTYLFHAFILEREDIGTHTLECHIKIGHYLLCAHHKYEIRRSKNNMRQLAARVRGNNELTCFCDGMRASEIIIRQ